MTEPITPPTPEIPAPPAPAPDSGGISPAPAPPAPEMFDRAYVEKLRQEAAGYRTKFQASEKQRADMLKAAGVEPEPGTPAPDAMQAQFGKLQAQIKDLKVTNALGDMFTKHGVKPVLAKAMLQSQGTLTSLDPDDAEFSKTLSGAIKKMADDYPELKVVQVPTTPARSGAEFNGGGDKTSPQLTREQLKGMTPEQIMDAKGKGLLDNLMSGK